VTTTPPTATPIATTPAQPTYTIPGDRAFRTFEKAKGEANVRASHDVSTGMTMIEDSDFQYVVASFDAQGAIGMIAHRVTGPYENSKFLVTSRLMVLTKEGVAGFLALAAAYAQTAANEGHNADRTSPQMAVVASARVNRDGEEIHGAF
jgi:hypothetical protein